MVNRSTIIKAGIFDIIVEQEQLNFRIAQLEELKKQKIQELNQVLMEESIELVQPEAKIEEIKPE